jgi:hypothetical protein
MSVLRTLGISLPRSKQSRYILHKIGGLFVCLFVCLDLITPKPSQTTMGPSLLCIHILVLLESLG